MGHEHSNILHYLIVKDFYTEVNRRMQLLPSGGDVFMLGVLDFDNFNYINDLFGYTSGDLVFKKTIELFSAKLNGNEMFSKLHTDHFAFCINSTESLEILQRFNELTQFKDVLKDVLPPHYNLVASGGAVIVKDNTIALSTLLDQANYARKKSKGNTVSSLNLYNKKMSKELQWQKSITCSMEMALKNREFEMYLQPKVLLKSDEVVGAEALVRWNSPEHGLIYPDNFIPIMERNGFIRQLDFFMLEEACVFLKECIERGKPILPISVNFSRVHLETENLVEHIFQTVNKFDVSTSLIEIELGENLFISNFEKLIEIVTDLRLLGFKVSLDDFGSAYSSLNCLKELPVNTIKIDKGFLASSSNTDKGQAILAKMVELIKSLHILSVMEGIETNAQSEFMQKLNCDLGQGYFYAKPMPACTYIEYLHNNKLPPKFPNQISTQLEQTDDSPLNTVPQKSQMDNCELYTLGKNVDIGLIKAHIDNRVTVEYVNDRTLEYLGYTRNEFREIFYNNIMAFAHPDDLEFVHENAKQLIATGESLPFKTRAIRKDGKIIILKGRSSCVTDSQGRHIGLYALHDVTNELVQDDNIKQDLKKKIEELSLSETRYRVIVEQSGDIVFDWDLTSDVITFSDKFVELSGRTKLIKGLTTNIEIRDTVHSDDLPEFERWINEAYCKPGRTTAQYRIQTSDGDYLWMRCCSTTICDHNGKPSRAFGVLSNINDQKNKVDMLVKKSQSDSLTKLLNKEETRVQISNVLNSFPEQSGAFFIVDIDNFKGLNDNLGHQLGDTVLKELADTIRQVFSQHDIIGRIGGDEIAVFMRDCDQNIIYRKAEQLKQALHISYYGSATKYNVSASVGIAIYPDHGQTFDELYHFADVALYESKHSGKDQYKIYHKNMIDTLLNNRTPVEWSNGFLNTYFQKDFPFSVFQMLYETKDLNASVQMVLELLGKRYHVDRVYIFQDTEDTMHTSNTFEWCAPGITPEINSLQNLSKETMSDYFSAYSPEGIFCYSNIRDVDPRSYSILSAQGIKSVLHCAIYDKGQINGFIGFDMCKQHRDWTGEEIAVLGYISRILSIFLINTETDAKLQKSNKNYLEMLDNLNGYVYVIDLDTYDLLYINNATQAFSESGKQKCYQMAFDTNKPCHNCPVQKLSNVKPSATQEIYSHKLNCWVSAAASRLKWEGIKNAALICCMDISMYKKDPPNN